MSARNKLWMPPGLAAQQSMEKRVAAVGRGAAKPSDTTQKTEARRPVKVRITHK